VFDELTDSLRKRSVVSMATVGNLLFVNLAGETVQRQYEGDLNASQVMALVVEEV